MSAVRHCVDDYGFQYQEIRVALGWVRNHSGSLGTHPHITIVDVRCGLLLWFVPAYNQVIAMKTALPATSTSYFSHIVSLCTTTNLSINNIVLPTTRVMAALW